MALPKIDLPTYDVSLVSRGLTKFRPFTVKEQKILMAALETEDFDVAIASIKQVINNCLVEKIDVDELPMIDLELLFLAIRSKSMGEKLNLYFNCNQPVPTDMTGNTKPCGMVLELEVNIDQLEPIKLKDKRIQLTPDIIVEMKYPTFNLINLLQKANNAVDAELIVVGGCLDKFYNKNEVINVADASVQEVIEFLESLTDDKYEKLISWVRSTPKVRKKVETVCPKCSKKHEIQLEGLADFFT
jgi:hypothetical protein